MESVLDESLKKLNGAAGKDPSFRFTAIHHIKRAIEKTAEIGLLDANKEFFHLICDNDSIQFGDKGNHVPVHYIDFEHPENNNYIVSSRVVYPQRKNGREFDIVLYVNGIPLVIGETKSPVSNVDWSNGARDINEVYVRDCEKCFVTNVFSFACDGKRYRYAAIGTPIEKWGPWRTDNHKEEGNLQEVATTVRSMLVPEVILDIAYNFSVYFKKKDEPTKKVICRYQQYEAANKIIERVKEGKIKKGLIWHFQGSGKSLLMVFAAQKLRRMQSLNNPTVLIVVDRTDLDSQISGTFRITDVPNTKHERTVYGLKKDLNAGIRKILITTIQKFREIETTIDNRSNIIVFADEAHRTEYGNFGNCMRIALPNGFYFGFTGTPLNEARRNTFDKFGSEADPGGYLCKYTYEEAVSDKAILELHFEAVPFEIKIDHGLLNKEFNRLMEEENGGAKGYVARRACNIANVMSSPENVKLVCDYIIEHYKKNVAPNGHKAMVVAADRYCCHLYKKYFDQYLPKEMTEVVISASSESGKAEKEELKQYHRDKDQQERLLERYNKRNDPFKILIVTNKLLTGFDSPVLQTIYMAKMMVGHNLLQAVCRANRPYDSTKTCGRIVDFLGIFSKFEKAMTFDGVDMAAIVSNFNTLREKLPLQMDKCMSFFPGVDTSVYDDESLEAARLCLPDKDTKESFADAFVELHKLWEAVSPDSTLGPYIHNYIWLCQVYNYIMPPNDYNETWQKFGEKTIELIRKSTTISFTDGPLEILVFDADLVTKAIRSKSVLANVHSLKKSISRRIRSHPGDEFFTTLSDHLEDLRRKHEDNEITSIEFLKEMLVIAKQLVEEENRRKQIDPREEAKKKLTQCFEKLKTDKTPKELEVIVHDIDEIVVSEECRGWKNTKSQNDLLRRKIAYILRFNHSIEDYDLIDKVFDYVVEYYRDVETP